LLNETLWWEKKEKRESGFEQQGQFQHQQEQEQQEQEQFQHHPSHHNYNHGNDLGMVNNNNNQQQQRQQQHQQQQDNYHHSSRVGMTTNRYNVQNMNHQDEPAGVPSGRLPTSTRSKHVSPIQHHQQGNVNNRQAHVDQPPFMQVGGQIKDAQDKSATNFPVLSNGSTWMPPIHHINDNNNNNNNNNSNDNMPMQRPPVTQSREIRTNPSFMPSSPPPPVVTQRTEAMEVLVLENASLRRENFELKQLLDSYVTRFGPIQ
jgi:hypothetical protein